MRTIRELDSAYLKGSTSPVKFVEETLERIDKANAGLNCFITVLRESSLEQAAASERRLREGARLGPLDGVPIAVKDLIYIKGVRCTAGSKILQDNVASYDSPVASRLKAAGAVIVGTTNLHEFAAGVTSVNPHYGPVRNPWDASRIAGGSSGGSAAAVSAELASAAIGTDTAGSVRIPASLCGVVGFKPTYGLISRIGVIPLASSFDTVGTLTNSSWDAGALLNVLAGHDEGDVTTADVEPQDYVAELLKPTGSIRIGVPKHYFQDSVDGGTREVLAHFLDKLRDLGCEVTPTEVESVDRAYETWLPIRRAEATAFHEEWLKTKANLYGDDVRKSLELGGEVAATRYINAQNSRPRLRESFLKSMEQVDFIATPATSVAATVIGETSVDIEGKPVEIYPALNRLTLPFNVVGFPAVSFPAGSERGLPVGVQLVAKPFEDARLLRLLNAYESKYGTFPPPPLRN